jgi:hypothetical protein
MRASQEPPQAASLKPDAATSRKAADQALLSDAAAELLMASLRTRLANCEPNALERNG